MSYERVVYAHTYERDAASRQGGREVGVVVEKPPSTLKKKQHRFLFRGERERFNMNEKIADGDGNGLGRVHSSKQQVVGAREIFRLTGKHISV